MRLAQAVVLDTNIVLDLFVFHDPKRLSLIEALQSCTLQWMATPAMRNELMRVLTYPQIDQRLKTSSQTPNHVLARMDALAHWCEPSPKAPFTCKDLDDQIFIDLACQHQCLLISKDKAVLAMRSRLARVGVTVSTMYQSVH